MAPALPLRIVAGPDALAADLATWCTEGREASLAEHEAAVLKRVRRVLPSLLQAVVKVATSGPEPQLARARQACPSGGRQARPVQARRARQVQTQCGLLEVVRPWYHCGRCGRGRSVVETTLGVAGRAWLNAGLAAWAVRLGAAAPFREAAELLEELTGLGLGAETSRRQAESAGAALEADGAMVRFTDS